MSGARAVGAFLGGRAAPRPSPGGWLVDRRRAEGGEWAVLADPARESVARDEALAAAPGLDEGDLVRLRAPGGAVRAVWVFCWRGLVDAGPVPAEAGRFGRDWVAAWESPGLADGMLAACAGLDRRRLVRAACDCAAAAGPFLARTATAELAALRGLVADAGPEWTTSLHRAEVAWAARALASPGPGADLRARYGWLAVRAALECLAAVDGLPDALDRAATSARAAAATTWLPPVGRWVAADRLTDPRQGAALAALGPAVRRHAPLSAVLLARAGHELPPDPGWAP